MVSAEERELVADMNRIMNEGMLSRDERTSHSYKPGSVEEFLHVTGWLKRDLQISLHREIVGCDPVKLKKSQR